MYHHPGTGAVVIACLSLLAAGPRPAASLRCDDGDASFELLAGYAASPAAKHAMRQQLALFTLPQCISACKSDDQCAAITYETGVCVSYAAVPQKNANTGTYSSTFGWRLGRTQGRGHGGKD